MSGPIFAVTFPVVVQSLILEAFMSDARVEFDPDHPETFKLLVPTSLGDAEFACDTATLVYGLRAAAGTEDGSFQVAPTLSETGQMTPFLTLEVRYRDQLMIIQTLKSNVTRLATRAVQHLPAGSITLSD
ncbi:MAG TPA: hypothetical protein VF597_01150 [Candidatus Saccharimonadales bacterium]|jgi:hypothetical protein